MRHVEIYHSIRFKAFFLFLITAIVVSVLAGFYFRIEYRAEAYEKGKNQGLVLANRSALNFFVATTNFYQDYFYNQSDSKEEILKHWRELIRNADLAIIHDFGADEVRVRLVGDELIFQQKPQGGRDTQIEIPFERKAAETLLKNPDLTLYEEKEGNLLRLSTPLYNDAHPGCGVCHSAEKDRVGRRLLGTLNAYVPMEKILIQAEEKAEKVAFFVGLAFFISFTVLYVLIRRTMVTPLTELSLVAESVRTKEDYALRTDISRKDEIGFLAHTFNHMLSEIELRDRRLRNYTRELEDALPFPLLVISYLSHQLLHSNPATLRFFAQIDQETIEAFLEETDLLAILEQRDIIDQIEVKFQHHDRLNWVLLSARLLSYQGEDRVILVTLHPINERKKMEVDLGVAKEQAEQSLLELQKAKSSLVQSEKMASLGGLVAGIAHEINTPVGNTLAAVSQLEREAILLKELFEGGKMKKRDLETYLETTQEGFTLMQTNIRRASELIQSFKQVAVDQTSEERRVFNLKSYLEEVVLSLRPRLKRTRHTIKILCPDGVVLDSYPGALAQVVTNFIMNALIHAYDEGDAGQMCLEVAQLPQEQISLIFSDNGKGIPHEFLTKVFDPFFTTKRGAGGTGLGLHIVFNIVVNTLEGSLTVESEPGNTRFCLYFPKVAKN